jgi:hypothetical protein
MAEPAKPKVHKLTLLSHFNSDGVQHFCSTGEAFTADGVKLVRSGRAILEYEDGWHDSREEAEAAIADQIEEIGLRILSQAKRFRREVPDGSTPGS